MVKCRNKSPGRRGNFSVLVDFQNLIGQDREKPDLTLKLALFLGRGLDWELEKFFPNRNYSDSVIPHVVNPCLILQRFRGLGNRMHQGKCGERRGLFKGVKTLKTAGLSSLTFIYRLYLWSTKFLPFFDVRRLSKCTSMSVGS